MNTRGQKENKIRTGIHHFNEFLFEVEKCRQMAQNPMIKNFIDLQIESPHQELEQFIEGLA